MRQTLFASVSIQASFASRLHIFQSERKFLFVEALLFLPVREARRANFADFLFHLPKSLS